MAILNRGMAGAPQGLQMAYMRDPRLRLAQQLQMSGADTSPVGHWSQGLARLAQALAGNRLEDKADSEYRGQAEAYQNDMRGFMAPVMEQGAAGPGPRQGPGGATMRPANYAELSERAGRFQSPYAMEAARPLMQAAMTQEAAMATEQRRAQAAKDLEAWKIQNDPSKQLPAVRLYEAYKAQGYTGSLADFQKEQARLGAEGSGPETFGITPTYGTDAQGNPVMLQMGSRGTVRPAQLPPGVSPSPGTQRVDLGTTWGVLDRNGNLMGTIPKDLAGAARATATGKAAGEDEAKAPQEVVSANSTLQTIDGILSHPGMSWGTGKTSFLNAIPGTEQYDFGQRVQQLQGQAFLQAFQSLKGGGTITEVEGKKAEQAIARLNTSLSEKDFRQALGELRDVAIAARARAEAKMPQTGQATGAMNPPAAGGDLTAEEQAELQQLRKMLGR
jgi:hypothetical protein